MRKMEIKNPTVAPDNYTDFCEQYAPYVSGLLRTKGCPVTEVEEMTQEIMTKMIEKDIIHIFEPELVFEFDGEPRPARFKSFVSAFVSKYSMSQGERSSKYRYRNQLILDAPLNDEADATFGDILLGSDESPEDYLVAHELPEAYHKLRAHLAVIPLMKNPKRTPRLSHVTLRDVFDVMYSNTYSMTKTSKHLDPQPLRDKYEVSENAARRWMDVVRAEAQKFFKKV